MKMKKVLSVLLSTVCVLSLLAGCGNQSNNAESSVNSTASTQQAQTQTSEVQEEKIEVTYPLKLDEEVTITIGMVEAPGTTAYVKDMTESRFGKEWMERTGVNIEVVQVANEQAMNLLIASGDLPDIIMFGFNQYDGGIDKAVADGVVVPITDYLEYCPDYVEVINSTENILKGVTLDSGEIPGFAFIRGDDQLLCSAGLIARTDWLQDWGKELPETPDEMYDLLKYIKEEKGATIPFSMDAWYLLFSIQQGMMTSAFGMPRGDFYVEDGQVHYGLAEKELKDVLAWFKKLYDDGLFDPNFASADANTVRANIMNGVTGVCVDTAGSGLGSIMRTMEQTDENFMVEGFGPLVAKRGDTPMSTHYDNCVTDTWNVITPACENIEVAVQLMNYMYTRDGQILWDFGIEGLSFEYAEDGSIQTLKVPEDASPADKCSAGGSFYYTASLQTKDSLAGLKKTKGSYEAVCQWSDTDAAKHHLPSLSLPADQVVEAANIMTDIETFAGEMVVRYISGLADLDKFETEYLAVIESMGINDVIEWKQAAYEKYLAR